MPKAKATNYMMTRHAVRVFHLRGTPWYEAEFLGYTTTKANTFVCPSTNGYSLRSTTPEGMQRELVAKYGARFQPCKITTNGKDFKVGYMLPPGVWEVPVPQTDANVAIQAQARYNEFMRVVARAQASAQRLEQLL